MYSWDATHNSRVKEKMGERAKHTNKLLGRYKIEVEKSSNIKSLYNKQTLAAMEQASNMYSQKEAKTNTNRKHPWVFLPMQTHLNQFKWGPANEHTQQRREKITRNVNSSLLYTMRVKLIRKKASKIPWMNVYHVEVCVCVCIQLMKIC